MFRSPHDLTFLTAAAVPLPRAPHRFREHKIELFKCAIENPAQIRTLLRRSAAALQNVLAKNSRACIHQPRDRGQVHAFGFEKLPEVQRDRRFHLICFPLIKITVIAMQAICNHSDCLSNVFNHF